MKAKFKKQTTKRGQDKAEISALLTSKKSFSLQRLMHDYKEIKNQLIPIPGVSAAPLDDDFYEWHGNIKSSTTDIYKGAVIHIRMAFPKRYPIEPPVISLMNKTLKHPNVMPDGRICLDILEKKVEKFRGWRSGYTVLTILLQLQNFFFDVDETFIKKEDRPAIQEAVIAMGEFKCPKCKHRGSSNPYPEFFKVDQDMSLFRLSPEKYKEVKLQELCCYHRKTTFLETPLGLGITISKIPRTGEIKGVVPCFSFISLKSYTKEKVRTDFEGNRFTHWFPLYFGVKPEKFLLSVSKAISMIAKGNTKEFSPDLILKVMPKFFNNIALNIMSEKVHNSSVAIRTLIYVYRILLILLQNYPSFKKEINDNIDKFIKDEKSRVKEFTPSLGDLLVMMALSSEHKIEDLLPGYINEQMDRQIFWILQEIPEFEKLINTTEIDDIRAKVCFKCGLVGEQLLLFYYYFIKKMIFGSGNTLEDFANKLDKNYCNLSDEEIDKHRLEIDKILKIDNFNDFYKYLNLTPPTEKELNEKLKQSFTNSLNKGYHGKDEVRFVPGEKEQAEAYLKRYPQFDTLLNNNQLLQESDPKWFEMVSKLDIVTQFKYAHPNCELTPLNIVRFERENLKDQLFFDSKLEKEKVDHIGKKFKTPELEKKIEDEDIIKGLSWRQLYLKLFLEDYIKFFPYIADFKELYKILDIVKKDIVHFRFTISTLGNLKSDWNYVRVVLSKLINLKYLCLLFKNAVSIKLLKNMIKGVTNASKENSAITHLKIITNPSAYINSTKDVNLLTILDKMPSLKVLDLSNVKLDLFTSLRIRNHLYYYKIIEVLDLSGTGLNEEMAKEIADGIMKAKALEKIYLMQTNTTKGLSSILYNLAFQPKIKLVDISNNSSIDRKETSIALYKLLKMSQTIETLIFRHIMNFNKELTKDFYYALGDSNSLVNLDLSFSGNISNSTLLGKAVAFNALKNGSLKHLAAAEAIQTYDMFTQFISGMEVCESDHFTWYGCQFNSNIQKDSTDFYKKTFHCKLQYLNISKSAMMCYVNINDVKNIKKENPIKNLLSRAKTLETLIMNHISTNKYFLDMLTNALYEENSVKYLDMSNSNISGEFFKSFVLSMYKKGFEEVNPNFHIELLDVSNNKLGYNGIECLCKGLKVNKTVKYLNVFHNLFDVNGARRFQEVLSVNSTLEELDIGYNRIKDVGFEQIISGIKANKDTKIKFLGAKYNFIKDECFKKQMNEIVTSQNIKIEELDMKNNSISELFLAKFYEDYLKLGKKVKIDIFDVLYFLQPERLERTVWISCGPNSSANSIEAELNRCEKIVIKEDKSHLGIPLFIRKKRGRKVGQKKTATATDCFVEFILPNSANRMLKVASTLGFNQYGKKTRVCKAGTKPDFLVVKKRVNN